MEIVSYCIEHGNDYTAAIEKYGVSYQQIYSRVRKYNEKGAEGLVDKRGKRKPESEMTELEKLRAENRMLEARNKRLELECAVLKNSRKSKGGGAERCTIGLIYAEHNGTYGYRRIADEYNETHEKSII